MIKSGICNLPLHYGSAPKWLFDRMVKLGRVVSEVIIEEYGKEEFLKRLSDPFFFQAFANVLGWDFHSSGATPVLCGALKQANLQEFGIVITGGKGKTSRKTPQEIKTFGDSLNLSTQRVSKLEYASKMTAKIDNNLIQDRYFLYHHSFFFTEDGEKYMVIQQGMNTQNSYARRYHWLSDNVNNFVEEPHSAICCDEKKENVLDLTAKESRETRKTSLDLVKDNPKHLEKYFMPKGQKTLFEYSELTMEANHYNLNLSQKSLTFLKKAYEFQPKNYEELVALKNMGPKTIRALALVSELVYGTKPSWQDPARFSFSHGGKDGVPYDVNKELMDQNTEFLREALKQSRLGFKDKLSAIKKLKEFIKK